MNSTVLWAKSKQPDEREQPSMRLSGHLADVHAAAGRVLDSTADDQLRALGLDPKRYRDRLRRCVLLAAAVHDLGKANDHFQSMLTGRRDVRSNPQGLRHEWISVLILKTLREWLLPAAGGNDADLAIVEWAVSGHHPAFDRSSPPRSCPAGAGPKIRLLTGHPDMREILCWLRETFGLESPPTLADEVRHLVGSGNVYADLADWARSARSLWEELSRDTSEKRFVAAVKSCLIAADVAGSALPRDHPNGSQRWESITRSFANVPEPGDLATVAERRLNGAEPRPFQSEVAKSQAPVTYVKAGCGTGKTVAAYLWAAANHPTRRLHFCYPTTGTATEGFRDYLFEPEGELDCLGARLFHSRRDVDFEVILGTGKDTKDSEVEQAARREALEAWSTPIVACTVDTVLGIVQNNRRGLFAWPALAQSAFVFDEIHAYDDRLFGGLLRFLRDLPGLPCLLMTASLPKAREEALARTIRDVHGFDLATINGPSDLEQLPRYHKLPKPKNDPLPLVERELGEGGKVLWVCNTVGRVMDAAHRAAHLSPRIYHSRFRYVDRVERHREVVEAFTTERQEPALAICSQVAEMSLDLKGCTMLVTDLAPVPALIQRLGRLNRQARAGDPTRPFVVVEPDASAFGWHLPYTPAEFDAARAWLGRLPEKEIHQRHLVDSWEQAAEDPPDLVPSAWLDGGPATSVAELREASPGITVILHDDLPEIRADRTELVKRVLPMPPPRSADWRDWPKEQGIPIAPPGRIWYDATRGAAWHE